MSKVLESTRSDPSARSREQAKLLRGVLMALGRNLLSIDDLTLDLPIRQLRICLALYARSGSMSEISRQVGVSLSAMTQVADRLERSGLVERVFQDSDRRVRQLQLTDRGRELMRRHEESQLERMAGVLEGLSKNQVCETLEALNVLVAASAPKQQDSST